MILEAALNRLIKIGTLSVTFPNGKVREFGDGGEPRAGLHIRTNRVKRRLARNPALALGEAYMDGDLEPIGSDLFSTLDFLAMNSMDGGNHPFDKLMERVRWFRRRLDQLNPVGRSKKNVAHHYDLDGRLYAVGAGMST